MEMTKKYRQDHDHDHDGIGSKITSFEILINYTHKFRLLVIYRAGSCDEKGEGMGRRVRIRKKCVKRG